MDYKNYHRYRLGRSYTYWGGRSRELNFEFKLSGAGRYIIVVDKNGSKGKVGSSIHSHGSVGPSRKVDQDGVVDLPRKTV